MGEGERRAGGVQAAAYDQLPLTSPPGALEALFREHHGAVYRAAYRITGNAMDAEDVRQFNAASCRCRPPTGRQHGSGQL